MINDKTPDRIFMFLMASAGLVLLFILFGCILPDAIESWRRALS